MIFRCLTYPEINDAQQRHKIIPMWVTRTWQLNPSCSDSLKPVIFKTDLKHITLRRQNLMLTCFYPVQSELNAFCLDLSTSDWQPLVTPGAVHQVARHYLSSWSRNMYGVPLKHVHASQQAGKPCLCLCFCALCFISFKWERSRN